MRNCFVFLVVTISFVFASGQAFGGKFWKYGNYGWVHYSSGQKATGYFPTDFSKPPIDSLDELFMKHDQVYWAAKKMGGRMAHDLFERRTMNF